MGHRASIESAVRRRVLCGVAAGALGASVPGRAQPQPDAAPFDWPEITLLDGTVWTPGSWRGLAAVVVVWATWCPFCLRHNEHVERLHRETRGRPIRVLGASLDRDPELVRRHVREHGLTFPVALAGETIRTRLGLRRVTPTTLTFDRQSRLLQRIPGEMFEEDVLALARLADGPA